MCTLLHHHTETASDNETVAIRAVVQQLPQQPQYAQPKQAVLTDGSEEVKQEMLHALRRPPAKAIKSRVTTSAPAKNQPVVDRAYGRE